MSPRPRYARSCCCVPFCRSTSTLFRPGVEWVCADHWRLIDRALKRVRSRLVRRWKREGKWDRRECWPAIHRTLDGWWKRVKRQAIERAAGASA